MNAELMDRVRMAVEVQTCARRMEEAAVEYELACETCAQTAGDASAWCGSDDVAELAGVSETLGERLAEARDCARDVYRAAVCVADGVIGEAMKEMTDRERLEAWAVLIHGVAPEVDVMDSEGRMLARGRSVRKARSRRRNRQGGAHG